MTSNIMEPMVVSLGRPVIYLPKKSKWNRSRCQSRSTNRGEHISTGIEKELQELNTKVEALQGEVTGIHATPKDLPKQILTALDACTTATAGIEPIKGLWGHQRHWGHRLKGFSKPPSNFTWNTKNCIWIINIKIRKDKVHFWSANKWIRIMKKTHTHKDCMKL